jgi:rare lipoprotein A
MDSAPTEPKKHLDTIPNATPKWEKKSRYGNPESYEVFGIKYYVKDSNKDFTQSGLASWYGTKFHGRRTSSGEPYDMYAMTAAHKTLPLPSYVEVTNLDNQKRVVVRVNDRGPFHEGRIIDLSYTAAWKLDVIKKGTAPVSIRVITPGEESSREQSSDAANGRYIQLGLFSSHANAATQQQKITNDFSTLQPSTTAILEIREIVRGGKTLYQLITQPGNSQTTMTSLQKSLQQMGIEGMAKSR